MEQKIIKEDKLLDRLNNIHEEIHNILRPTVNQRHRMAIYIDHFEPKSKDDTGILNELKTVLIATKPAKYDPICEKQRQRLWNRYCEQCKKMGIEPK